MQLDIFADSRNVMLRRAAADALLRQDLAAAADALISLAREFHGDELLPDLTILQQACAEHGAAAFRDHDVLAQARCELDGPVSVAAARVYVGTADKLLRPLWQDLAQRAQALPLDRARPEDHAIPLWLRAHAWSQAADALALLPSWRRIPLTLGWMIEACYRLAALDHLWPLLAELAWLAPARFARTLAALADPNLERLRRDFDSTFEADEQADDGDDHAWWPAWVLIERPALQPWFALAEPAHDQPAERAMRTVARLLLLERAGRQREIVGCRAELRALNGCLFARYMRTR